jgi:taurine dioxygenase
MSTVMERDVTPSGRALGAEVTGVDLSRPLDADVVDFLKTAWRDNLVLLFRHQKLEDTDLLRIAEALGGSQATGSRQYFVDAGYKEGSARVSKLPGISYISNLDEDGKPFLKAEHASGSQRLFWHTDNSYVETPPSGSLLYSLQVPVNGGGETLFANQYAAYESLADDLKARIAGLHVRHDNSRNTAGGTRPTRKLPATRDEVEGPVHPLVRIHPLSGRKALYLGRRYAAPSSYIVELPEAESEALLDTLWAHATRPELTWGHSWTPGEALLWDNRCTLHSRTPADHTQPRVLHRTLVKGEAIIGA